METYDQKHEFRALINDLRDGSVVFLRRFFGLAMVIGSPIYGAWLFWTYANLAFSPSMTTREAVIVLSRFSGISALLQSPHKDAGEIAFGILAAFIAIGLSWALGRERLWATRVLGVGLIWLGIHWFVSVVILGLYEHTMFMLPLVMVFLIPFPILLFVGGWGWLLLGTKSPSDRRAP